MAGTEGRVFQKGMDVLRWWWASELLLCFFLLLRRGGRAAAEGNKEKPSTTRRPGRVPPLHAALTLQYSTVLPVPVLYARGLLLLHACMRCSMQLHIWAAEALTPSPYVGSSYACRLPAVGGPMTGGHPCLPY